MGYKTPNIDSIAKEGALFTDWYGQQSCTAGRAAFITGQSPIRTGLTKVGLPGAPEGMKKEDPTIATLLKAQGYMTGQFGKNHLGDRDEMLPTAHGFDEFFGNLYHLNAEEEPENPDYPKDPEFKKKFGPRGVIHSFADGRITDTGPLTRKRMETIDDEVTAKTLGLHGAAKKEDKPFFIWWNSTRMHIWTHLKQESEGKTGLGIYPDGMVEHDAHVGQVLAKLKELGLDENTIVMYSTDNGAETMSWPDGGTTMFRGEKNTNWEGGYRVPAAIRWPGVIKPGTVINDIGCARRHAADAASPPRATRPAKEDLLKGRSIGGTNYKVHLDGYDLGPALQGEAPWPRKEFIYWTDDGSVAALRYNHWKMVFLEQRGHGFDVWQEPFVDAAPAQAVQPAQRPLRARGPRGHGLRDSGASTARSSSRPPARYVGQWLQSFREFPPRQKPGSFNLEPRHGSDDQAREQLTLDQMLIRMDNRAAPPTGAARVFWRPAMNAKFRLAAIAVAADRNACASPHRRGPPTRCPRGTTAPPSNRSSSSSRA